MASVEDRKMQRMYYETVREEFAREGRSTSTLGWLCRVLTYVTPFGIRVNYSRSGGGPYQLRVYLTPKWLPWGVCLHHFFRGDQDEEYHNHPWFFGRALILCHGYVEHYLEQDTRKRLVRVLRPWDWNTIRNTDRERTWHRLELQKRSVAPLRPWTLFFHGRRIKDESDGIDSWGFFNVDTSQYTGWRKFVDQPPSRNEATASGTGSTEAQIDITVDMEATPPRGTVAFDLEEEPTTPIPVAVLKEARDASLCTRVSGESELRACLVDPEGTP